MIEINTTSKKQKVIDYLKKLRKMNIENSENDTFLYSCLGIHSAFKYNCMFNDFIFHPLMLKTRKFYEYENKLYGKKQIIEKINEILNFELLCTEEENKLSEKTLSLLIKVQKRLSNKRKKEINVNG